MGVARLIAPTIFEKCNYEVKQLWCDVDPLFPNRSSEPTPTSLKELSRLVIKNNANFGVGFDGDGDRAVIVDDTGNILSAEEIGIIVARFLIQQSNFENPLVLANIACSSLIEESIADLCQINRIKVGHTYLTLEAKKHKNRCLIGIESSGHFVFHEHFFFDDAMLLPLIVGQIISQGEKLSKSVQSLPKVYTKQLVVNIRDEIKFNLIQDLIKKIYARISSN